jgi:hypothetical protein
MEHNFMSHRLGIWASFVEMGQLFFLSLKKLFLLGVLNIALIIVSTYFLEQSAYANGTKILAELVLVVSCFYFEIAVFYGIKQMIQFRHIHWGALLSEGVKKWGRVILAHLIIIILYMALFFLFRFLFLTFAQSSASAWRTAYIFIGIAMGIIFWVPISMFMPAIIFDDKGLFACFSTSIKLAGSHFFATLWVRIISILIMLGWFFILSNIGFFVFKSTHPSIQALSAWDNFVAIDAYSWIELVMLFTSLFLGNSILSVWYHQLKLRMK